MVKLGWRPICSAYSRSSLAPIAWNVPAQVSASVITPAFGPSTLEQMLSTRRPISEAARREKVISRIRRGSIPLTIRFATRCARVLVFPDPAPAMTRSGAAISRRPPATPCSTARRCSAFSLARGSGSIEGPGVYGVQLNHVAVLFTSVGCIDLRFPAGDGCRATVRSNVDEVVTSLWISGVRPAIWISTAGFNESDRPYNRCTGWRTHVPVWSSVVPPASYPGKVTPVSGSDDGIPRFGC